MNPVNYFSKMPEEIQRHILSFAEPEYGEYASARDVKKCAERVCALISKESRLTVTEKLQELKKQYLEAKYCAYKSDYGQLVSSWQRIQSDPSRLEDPFFGAENRRFLVQFDPSIKPHLLDALFTGCNLPYAGHSQSQYTEEVESDIKGIVQLMPENLNYGFGSLRLRSHVPPLGAAVINENIPISLIEWLFQNGANPNASWGCVNNSSKDIRIINCLKHDYSWLSEFSFSRRQALIELFERYGAVEEDLSLRQ